MRQRAILTSVEREHGESYRLARVPTRVGLLDQPTVELVGGVLAICVAIIA